MNGIKEKNRVLLERALSGDRMAEEELIKENMGLVKNIAARFTGRGTELEDLVQIGAMGMLKAIRGYDSAFNTAFSTYAVPMIMGEIKRYLRDDGLIKVSREAKRNYRILFIWRSRLQTVKKKYKRELSVKVLLFVRLCLLC